MISSIQNEFSRDFLIFWCLTIFWCLPNHHNLQSPFSIAIDTYNELKKKIHFYPSVSELNPTEKWIFLTLEGFLFSSNSIQAISSSQTILKNKNEKSLETCLYFAALNQFHFIIDSWGICQINKFWVCWQRTCKQSIKGFKIPAICYSMFDMKWNPLLSLHSCPDNQWYYWSRWFRDFCRFFAKLWWFFFFYKSNQYHQMILVLRFLWLLLSDFLYELVQKRRLVEEVGSECPMQSS